MQSERGGEDEILTDQEWERLCAKGTPFDPAKYLKTPEAETEFLRAAMEEGDTADIARAIGVIIRARGVTELARQIGMTRQALWSAFTDRGNPRLDTLVKVVRALGITVTFGSPTPAARKAAG